MKNYFLLLFIFILSGCLLTHKEIEEEKDYVDQEKEDYHINKEQLNQKKDRKKKAVLTVNGVSITEKISQMETSIRELRGQIEKVGKEQTDRSSELEQGLLSLIQTLDLRVATLAEEIKQQKKEIKKGKSKKQSDIVDLFQQAETFFQEKKWKKAIISYEKYRKENKKGKFYKQATFRMGLCFYNLNMFKEAKVFFREVLESFPNSNEAKESKKLLSRKKS